MQMNLDEVFLEKGSIATEIKQELTKVRQTIKEEMLAAATSVLLCVMLHRGCI